MRILRRSFDIRPLLLSVAALIASGLFASAQDLTTMTGTVVSATRNTLVVRSDGNQYQLFVFERGATRPASLPAGMTVRVTSTPGDEPSVRLASDVTAVSADEGSANRGGTASTSPSPSPVVPREVRRLESDIEREVRRFQVGVRAGVALDPELIMIGTQATVGPFFSRDLYLRPNVEFGFGEVTALFGLNLEAIYRLPLTSRTGRWSAYVGAGPGFNFIHRNFESATGGTNGSRVDFGDFKSDTGLNILGGMRFRSGMFTELRTSVYSDYAPTLRMVIGYNF
jgi:RNase P/RNase MRP subunit p29